MKLILLLIAFFQPLFLNANNIKAEVNIPNVYNIKLDNKQLLFGSFFEFLNEFINGEQGLWAQELYDRGFDDERNDTCGGVWKYYKGDNAKITFPLGGYNKNGYSYVNLNSDKEDTVGIFQSVYLDTEIGGNFYIYLRSNTQALSIFKMYITEQTSNQILFEKKLNLLMPIGRNIHLIFLLSTLLDE